MKGKMSRLQRAKQFIPFAALKGFDSLLAMVARHKEEPLELSEDQVEALDRSLRSLTCGDWVRVTFYDRGTYRSEEGPLTMVSKSLQLLSVSDRVIPFRDLKDIGWLPIKKSRP